MKMHDISEELARVKADFDKVEPAAKAAAKREEELTAQAKTSGQLASRIEGRFYWAPVLAELMQVVPREVQITRMGGDLSGGEAPRKCTITIDGLSAGADPRRVAEDLRTALAEKFSRNYRNVTSTFKLLEDSAEMQLDGKPMATATFAINVQLFTGEEPTTAPTRRKK